MQPRHLISPLLLAFATFTPVGGAASEGDSGAAKALLQAAKDIKRTANKQEEAEKQKILTQAVAAYSRVLEEQPDQAAECAEAAFRIGEIQRTLHATPAARSAFERVVTYRAAEPKFAARAVLELGHLARRAGDAAEAIARYEEVTAEFPAQSGEAAQAITWRGKMEAQRGNAKRAREIWLSLADRVPSEAVQAVRAADLAALSALKEGLADEARGIVKATRTRFSADNPDQEWWSPEVDQAISRMKSAGALDADDR